MTQEKRRKKLSQHAVEGLKPAAKPYRVWDTTVPQLFIRVQPSGIKSWNVQWSRLSSLALGKFPGVTVDAAQLRAQNKLVETSVHGQPLDVLKAAKPKAGTLRTYIDGHWRPWATANGRKWADGAADRVLGAFPAFADKPISAITAKSAEDWRAARVKDGVSQNTCNRDLAALKSALERACVDGVIESNPLSGVKQTRFDSTRVRFLSEDEESRLRSALLERDNAGRESRTRFNEWRQERRLDPLPLVPKGGYADHLTPAVLLSLNTGLRRGELTALQWSDVALDLNPPNLTVRAAAAKGGKRREIPLNAESVDVLKRWKRQQPSGRVFPFKDAKKAWGALLEAAKVTDFHWHDLRHSFASKLVMRSVDLNTVRELLGHATLAMTLRYAHLAHGHKADAVSLLCAPPAGIKAGKRGKVRKSTKQTAA